MFKSLLYKLGLMKPATGGVVEVEKSGPKDFQSPVLMIPKEDYYRCLYDFEKDIVEGESKEKPMGVVSEFMKEKGDYRG